MQETRVSEIRALLDEYVRVVDSRDLTRWPDLFATEASCRVTTRENLERGLPLCHVLDDSRERILDRVTTVHEVWRGHIDDYQPRHLVSNVVVAGADDEGEEFELWANVAIFVTTVDGVTSVLAVGEYLDRIVFEDGRPKLREKMVVLDTAVLPRNFVYPL